MTRVGFLFLGIGLLVAIIVLLLALLMSNRVYNPIGEMVRTASEEGLPSEAMARQLENTELYSIAQTYQTMVQRLNHINLRKEQEDLAAYLISREKTAKLPEWVEEIYAKPGVRIRVVVMRLSDIQDLHSNNTEEAIAFEMETIKTIVEQTLRELGNVLVLPVDREFIAVILFSEESVTEERVTVASQHILEVTGELIHIGMDVGISGEKGETEGFAELNLMYQMARAATAYRFIYGMGAVVLTMALYKFRNSPWWKIFLVSFVVGTVTEYICSLGQELVFGSVAWDYSNVPLNINGRVCLLYSIFWGILGIAWIKLIYPPMAKLIGKLPIKLGKVLTWAFIIFFIFDAILSASAALRMDQRDKGAAPRNAFECYLDEHFDDARMHRIYANSVSTDPQKQQNK